MGLVSGFIDDYGLIREVIEGIAVAFLKELSVKARKPEGFYSPALAVGFFSSYFY